jgi:hypothetical protein
VRIADPQEGGARKPFLKLGQFKSELNLMILCALKKVFN